MFILVVLTYRQCFGLLNLDVHGCAVRTLISSKVNDMCSIISAASNRDNKVAFVTLACGIRLWKERKEEGTITAKIRKGLFKKNNNPNHSAD